MKVNLYQSKSIPPGYKATTQIQLPNMSYPQTLYFDPCDIWINVPKEDGTVHKERFRWSKNADYIISAKVGYSDTGLLTAWDIYVIGHAYENI